MKFPIFSEEKEVGEVYVQTRGLYYQFSCVCTPPNSSIHRIILACDETENNLGICVPNGECFTLTKQVPIKNIKEGEWTFYLRAKDKENNLKVPVTENNPFHMLDKLEMSNLLIENGETFITFKDPL